MYEYVVSDSGVEECVYGEVSDIPSDGQADFETPN